jgi:hypothetical protein
MRVLPLASLAWLPDYRTREARTSMLLLLVSPRRPLTLERRPPLPKNEAVHHLDFGYSASRGYHLHDVHTSLYSTHNTRTLTTLRLRGISTRRLLPSVSTPVSSCAVPPYDCGGMLDSVCSMCSWAHTTIGLPAH